MGISLISLFQHLSLSSAKTGIYHNVEALIHIHWTLPHFCTYTVITKRGLHIYLKPLASPYIPLPAAQNQIHEASQYPDDINGDQDIFTLTPFLLSDLHYGHKKKKKGLRRRSSQKLSLYIALAPKYIIKKVISIFLDQIRSSFSIYIMIAKKKSVTWTLEPINIILHFPPITQTSHLQIKIATSIWTWTSRYIIFTPTPSLLPFRLVAKNFPPAQKYTIRRLGR